MLNTIHDPILRQREGAEAAVVFIHGFMGSPNQFSAWMDAAYQAGYSVAAVLLPGHGGDAKAFAKATCEDWQAHVRAELNALAAKHERICLVGHSMGGLLALRASLEPASHVAGVFAVCTPLKVRLIGIKKIRLLLHPEVSAAYRQANSVSGLGLFSLMRPWLELRKLIRRTKAVLPQVWVPVCLVHSGGDETTSPVSAKLLWDGLSNAPRQALTLTASRHAFFDPRESEQIKERLLAFLHALKQA